jgi:4-hydroxybenzoate polyprenyltransferase
MTEPKDPNLSPPVLLQGASLAERFNVYLAERFPPRRFGPLIVAFALSCALFGALARGASASPNWAGVASALFLIAILFFQLRVADEHRDYADDVIHHPERAVPRGLISRDELKVLAFGAGLAQACLALALHPPLLGLLLIAWAWIGLVWNDFFMKRVLEMRPALSLVLHLGVLPAFAMVGIGAEQLAVDGRLHSGVIAFMMASIATGAGLEIARKCVSPAAERAGVMTYSSVWGARRAGMAAAFAFAIALVFALLAFLAVRAPGMWFLPAAGVAAWAFIAAAIYAERPTPQAVTSLARAAIAWVIVLYLSLGVLPFLVRVAG